jgi:hypothetical protein
MYDAKFVDYLVSCDRLTGIVYAKFAGIGLRHRCMRAVSEK